MEKTIPLKAAPATSLRLRDELQRLWGGDHSHPHDLLGAHPASPDGSGVVVRAFHPDAVRVDCLIHDGPTVAMEAEAVKGVFLATLPDEQLPLRYQLRFHFADGKSWQRDDPYRFLPTLGDVDLHLFNEGTHRSLWKHLGAHEREMDGVAGVSFAVWAPNARRVSVVGDFCGWDGRLLPMRQMGSSGVFELFVPGVKSGALYRYEIKTADGHLRIKSDPMAFSCEPPPGNASRVHATQYDWRDAEWISTRKNFDPVHSPISIYEVHLGSWMRVPEEGNRRLSYRELAGKLIPHVKHFGFTHVELLPIAEHPFDLSWGYQVTGYFAPTARHGDPDDFRFFVDECHRNGIGVLLDWVPAHFPKDDFALRRFDGTALYEHEDSRRAEHPDWGTLTFNYARNEVRGFLIANAIYWLDEFHVDGLRVDAVASMLYLDYSRRHGQWVPNPYGGREDLDALQFLRALNEAVRTMYPGRMMIAEESTAWGGVTAPPADGGLGFTFKWNMGWMHDTLGFFSKEPVHRKFHHNDLTFAMLYEHTERFIMPLSHDEVVHGKRSLADKMPGDEWQKFANLRTLYAYQFTRPGKKLLFMGSEFAPWSEWYHDASLDWHLGEQPLRKGLMDFVAALGRLYQANSAFWKWDHEPGGFTWIDCEDRDNSVISYVRTSGAEVALVVLNLTPVPRGDYRIGALVSGRYNVALCSDDPRFGGSGWSDRASYQTDPIPYHRFPQSVSLQLPPLSALVLTPEKRA